MNTFQPSFLLKVLCAKTATLLKAAQGESAQAELDTEQLLKIGELAKTANVTAPTIRYWTQEDLLQVAEITPSGYQLYAPDMAQRCAKIQELKAQRLTLEEIKRIVSS